MNYQTKDHIAQLENEVHSLKAQLKQEQETKNNLLAALNSEACKQKKGTDFQNIFDNSVNVDELMQVINRMPDGTLYRMIRDVTTGTLSIHYTSGMWEKILGVPVEDSMADIRNIFSHVEKGDLKRLLQAIDESFESLNSFRLELRYHHPKKKGEYWIQISSYPHREGNFVYTNGFIFDITARKTGERNLKTEKERLQELNSELQATNEELAATNEELSVTTEELHRMNDLLNTEIDARIEANLELDRYRTQLEMMVESQTRELTVSQENLLSLSNRQALFIKVLQILQLEENVPKAMNVALAEIGKYTGMSRMQIWENHPDGVTYGCTYEWCNEGIEPAIHYLRVLPLEVGKPWFDMLAADNIIRASDIRALPVAIQEILEQQAVKSIVVLPLSHYGVHFGFISFTVCATREWNPDDVELLRSIAQIVATVTRRYQIEKTVQHSAQTLKTVLDNISSNIFVTDFESKKILFANKAFKDAAGQEVDGIECHKMLQAGRDVPCEHCPQAFLRDKNHHPTDYIHYWEDRNEITGRWYSIASTAIRWVDGRTAIMELATDITDRKQVEIELIRAKEKAEESDKLKSSFLANMSHEIRTPINGITGFVHLLNSDNLLPQRRREYINIINNSSTQLVKLIDDIIDIAKIEAKQMDMYPVPVQINSLMDELHLYFETYMQTNDKGHISLILDDSQFVDNLVVSVDLTRLRQVLTNLINNAIKFTEKGYIRFGYRQLTPCKLEFVVEDTGIGLNPGHKDIIFERFRQIELTNNRLYGGTGLGLSISRSLVQMMGGDLWVESVEDEGSTFYFTIVSPKVDEKPKC